MNFIVNESEQKLRGGYYTPLDLAVFIWKWIAEKKSSSILEPSCGDGVFLGAIASTTPREKINITAFELLEEEASKARKRIPKSTKFSTNIYTYDFLAWALKNLANGTQQFDAAVGNPPFIRYQYLPKDAQHRAEKIFQLLQLPFTKHTNAWVPFVLASVALLKPGGRLGMVVPAEIIHVTHAQSLRSYLGSTCSRILIIDPKEIWFDDTLQGAVILLAEKKDRPDVHSDGLGILSVSGREFAKKDPSKYFNTVPRINGRTVEGKWTRALLTTTERDLFDELAEHPSVHMFTDVAEVDVGIVTGANDFFLVPDEVVKRFRLQKWAHPMFGRSGHCPGIIYDKKQHAENSRVGNPSNFIWLTGAEESFNPSVRDYIKLGESQKLPARYKCKVRTPWYTVPSVYSTKVGMLKRAHDTPRLIYNRFGAYTTDTAYRIRTKTVASEKLVYCFLNSLTALSAELEGRYYGGGVLELVPSEIEKLLIPLPKAVRPSLRGLDSMVRKLSAAQVLEEQSRKILGQMGLAASKQNLLLEAWIRLRNRRQRVSGEDD